MKLFFIALFVTVVGLFVTKMCINHHWGSLAERLASEAAVPTTQPVHSADSDTSVSSSTNSSLTPPILQTSAPPPVAPAHVHRSADVPGEDDAAAMAAAQADDQSNQPVFPLPVARAALDYVGVDSAAEAVWLTAINDPNMPADARKNLIEDLNENGFADPQHPAERDLPLIEYRLNLIEQIRAGAMDDVNAAAFDEAYKDLLDLETKLTPQPQPQPEPEAETQTQTNTQQ